MNFKVNVMRAAAVAAVAAVTLASCGGGTQIDAFVPGRIIAFGDESSLINTDGTKYTVNTFVFDTTVDPAVPTAELNCAANAVWPQQLAYSYGMAFTGRCAGTNTSANGVMMANNGATNTGAKVSGLTTQVNDFLATNAFTNKDLVTVMVGVNDIIDAALNSPNPVAAVEAAGTQVGAEVVRITDRGAKVIVSTVPNVGFTPYAINREVSSPGTVAQLSDLTRIFNTRLRLKLQDVRDGGHAVGLVLADELVLAMVRNPPLYGLTNIVAPVCTVALPNCTITTLDPTAVATSYGGDWLWADDRHLGANAQSRIGSAAVNRARANPF